MLKHSRSYYNGAINCKEDISTRTSKYARNHEVGTEHIELCTKTMKILALTQTEILTTSVCHEGPNERPMKRK